MTRSMKDFNLQFPYLKDLVILSNDRFWDHEELRSGVIRVQFVLRSGELRVYDQATWFPSARGAAVVVPMEVLQRG